MEPPSSGPSSRPPIARALLLVVVVTLVAFAPTIRFGFVFDDQMLIEGNRNLEWSRVGRVVLSPLWAIADEGVPAVYRHLGRFFRPCISLSYLVDKSIYGLRPWGFHLTNVLMHALNTLGAGLFLRIFIRSAPLALALALAFALHPNSSEVVSAIHGRTDLFASTFALASIVAYVRGDGSPRAAAFFTTLFALALGSKEQILLLPGLLLLLPFLREPAVAGCTPRSRPLHWIGIGASILVFFLMRRAALAGIPASSVTLTAGDLGKCIAQVFKLAILCLAPWSQYRLVQDLDYTPVHVALEALACVTLVALAARRRPRLAALGALWFAACVLFSLAGSATVYEGELSAPLEALHPRRAARPAARRRVHL